MSTVADDLGEVRIRVLRPDEGARLGEAIRTAYGDSYDLPWVYDPHEVARRISDGLLISRTSSLRVRRPARR